MMYTRVKRLFQADFLEGEQSALGTGILAEKTGEEPTIHVRWHTMSNLVTFNLPGSGKYYNEFLFY